MIDIKQREKLILEKQKRPLDLDTIIPHLNCVNTTAIAVITYSVNDIKHVDHNFIIQIQGHPTLSTIDLVLNSCNQNTGCMYMEEASLVDEALASEVLRRSYNRIISTHQMKIIPFFLSQPPVEDIRALQLMYIQSCGDVTLKLQVTSLFKSKSHLKFMYDT